jgi:hypothetical protein
VIRVAKVRSRVLVIDASIAMAAGDGNEQSLGAIFEHLGSATSAVVDPDVSF